MFTIGKLAARSGVKVQTIRYYEQIGLMPEAERSGGNQRLYRAAHADRLGFIRHARELGFPLEAIRTLLDLSDRPDAPCDEADAIARARLADVDNRISRLTALRAELERMISSCSRGTAENCRVIEVLAASDHAECLSDHEPASAIQIATSP